jgi:hypothetical protein
MVPVLLVVLLTILRYGTANVASGNEYMLPSVLEGVRVMSAADPLAS